MRGVRQTPGIASPKGGGAAPPVSLTAVLILLLVGLTSPAAGTSPALQHAERYTGNEAIAGWMMSEKLDGIRGYWNGKDLLTRQGRRIQAPGWFTEKLPPFALDGELWRGRNDFAFVQATVMDTHPSDDWRAITYNIFEVPEAAGPFIARLDTARRWFAGHPAPHVRIIEQIVCRGPDHLAAFLASVEVLGGEGVIVKDPALEFEAGRTPYVLKVKHFSDMEGTVIAHNPGKGRLAGMMGSLTLRLANGVDFNLGTGFKDAERRDPPPVGAIVTFTYQGFTRKGIPRFASFLRVRRD